MGYKTVTIQPTLSTDAYADNDVLFNPTKIPDACTFNGGSKLCSVSITDTSANRTPMKLCFFQLGTYNIGSINATVNISDANFLANVPLGYIDVSAAKYSATNDIDNATLASAMTGGIDLVLSPAANSADIFVASIIQGGTPTYAADSLKFIFGFELK
jgi:hypothetical protein